MKAIDSFHLKLYAGLVFAALLLAASVSSCNISPIPTPTPGDKDFFGAEEPSNFAEPAEPGAGDLDFEGEQNAGTSAEASPISEPSGPQPTGEPTEQLGL